ncbi:type IIL restriction-modification enzyme MmeI, partial [Micrococcus lacusdianchii]|uniref:type IIL restriction-modification enzyme MmeI n=1 Tax=Micrococcus lacusdianchii TaxID=2915940 RepID=UPI0020029E9C
VGHERALSSGWVVEELPSCRAGPARLISARASCQEPHDPQHLETMYKPGTELLYPALFRAHKALDEAVERAYGLEPGVDEADLVAHLFELYAKAVGATS